MSLLSDWWKKLTQSGIPSAQEVPSVNLDQFSQIDVSPNTDQFRGGDVQNINTSITNVTGATPAMNTAPNAPDMSAVDAVFTGTGEAIRQTGTYLTRDLPNFFRNPAEQLGLNDMSMGMPDFGMGGSGGGGDGSGGGNPDTSTETTMTASEKRDKLRQLMASRYGKRETILTSGTGVAGFGV